MDSGMLSALAKDVLLVLYIREDLVEEFFVKHLKDETQ